MSYNARTLMFDVDGVILDFNKRFLEILNKLYGYNFSKKDVTDFDYTKCLGISKDQMKKTFEYICDKGYGKDMGF